MSIWRIGCLFSIIQWSGTLETTGNKTPNSQYWHLPSLSDDWHRNWGHKTFREKVDDKFKHCDALILEIVRSVGGKETKPKTSIASQYTETTFHQMTWKNIGSVCYGYSYQSA